MTMTAEQLLKQLNWRYATKKFDASRKIPDATWSTLERVLNLSPSAFGLQPWKFLVINDPDTRKKLREVSWNQPQITDASHLVVFTFLTNVTTELADRLVARTAEVRAQTVESLKGYSDMLTSFVDGAPGKGIPLDHWASRQAYLALGMFLSAAAMLEIDACPMEGIDPAGYDKVLGLKAKGLHAYCVATAGYRAADDKYASAAKVRFKLDEVIQRV